MKTCMIVCQKKLHVYPYYRKTYHHRAANDGMFSWQWDQRIYNIHVGNTVFVSRHVAQVSNMPNIEKAEGLGLISI